MTNGKGRSISEAPPAELRMAEGRLGGGVRHIPAVAKDTANLHGERTEGDGTRGATSVSLWGIELSVISGAGRHRLTAQITLLAAECCSCEATGLSALICTGGAEGETQISRLLSTLAVAQERLSPSRGASVLASLHRRGLIFNGGSFSCFHTAC